MTSDHSCCLDTYPGIRACDTDLMHSKKLMNVVFS